MSDQLAERLDQEDTEAAPPPTADPVVMLQPDDPVALPTVRYTPLDRIWDIAHSLRRKRLKQLIWLVDLVSAGTALVLADLLVAPEKRAVPGLAGGVTALLGALIITLVGAVNGLYRSRQIRERGEEARRALATAAQTTAGVAIIAFFTNTAVDRDWLLVSGLFAAIGLTLGRELLRAVFNVFRRRGRLLRRVLLVGAPAEVEGIGAKMAEDPTLGYQVTGVVDLRDVLSMNDPSAARRSVGTILSSALETRAHGVIIADGGSDAESFNLVLRQLNRSRLHVEVFAPLIDVAPRRMHVARIDRYRTVYIEPSQHRGWRRLAKRGFDVSVAAVSLLVLAIPYGLIALAVKLDSRGPVHYRQLRVGRRGELFPMLKFRSMVADADKLVIDLGGANEADGPLFKIADDPRITRVGRFLRRSSLDELPQLWNVLRNEMSLVGPRPALLSETEEWTAELFDRLDVKPGITGMWQVSGRSDASFDEYIRLDLYYVHNWSLAVDVLLLFRTIPAVLRSKGAY